MLVKMPQNQREAYLEAVLPLERRHDIAGHLTAVLPHEDRTLFFDRCDSEFERKAIEMAMLKAMHMPDRLAYLCDEMRVEDRALYLDHITEHQGQLRRLSLEANMVEYMANEARLGYLCELSAEVHSGPDPQPNANLASLSLT